MSLVIPHILPQDHDNTSPERKILPSSFSSPQLSKWSLDLWLQSKTLHWIIMGVGVILRGNHYLSNRSIWLDEALLIQNILSRSFSELWKPLNYKQGAPLGFLFVEKVAVQLLGNTEYALRLFPFIASILSLFLFYKVASLLVKPRAVTVALGLFALSPPLIYYAAEVKQYSSDVMIALLLYSIALYYLRQERMPFRHIVLCGLIVATALWFSHPAFFVLGGIGLAFITESIREKQWEKLRRILIVCGLGVVSFLIFYIVSLHDLANHKAFIRGWQASFMPFPPSSYWDIMWFLHAFFTMFNYPAGVSVTGAAALAFLVGCHSIFVGHKEKFFLLFSPILLTCLASGLQKYPFYGRLLLFLTPAILLLIAEGTEQIWEQTRVRGPVIGLTLLGLLFSYQVVGAIPAAVKPHTKEEIKPVLAYIKEHQQDGDVLYLYHHGVPAFQYYAERYGFSEDRYIIGSENIWATYKQDLAKLRGAKRVWILFVHVIERRADERKFFLYQLDTIGSRVDYFQRPGAEVYLYTLS